MVEVESDLVPQTQRILSSVENSAALIENLSSTHFISSLSPDLTTYQLQVCPITVIIHLQQEHCNYMMTIGTKSNIIIRDCEL